MRQPGNCYYFQSIARFHRLSTPKRMVESTTAGKKIMVERAMYWNSRGAGTDTVGGVRINLPSARRWTRNRVAVNREATRFKGYASGCDGENAESAGHLFRKDSNGGNISALEEAYEGCRR